MNLLLKYQNKIRHLEKLKIKCRDVWFWSFRNEESEPQNLRDTKVFYLWDQNKIKRWRSSQNLWPLPSRQHKQHLHHDRVPAAEVPSVCCDVWLKTSAGLSSVTSLLPAPPSAKSSHSRPSWPTTRRSVALLWMESWSTRTQTWRPAPCEWPRPPAQTTQPAPPPQRRVKLMSVFQPERRRQQRDPGHHRVLQGQSEAGGVTRRVGTLFSSPQTLEPRPLQTSFFKTCVEVQWRETYRSPFKKSAGFQTLSEPKFNLDKSWRLFGSEKFCSGKFFWKGRLNSRKSVKKEWNPQGLQNKTPSMNMTSHRWKELTEEPVRAFLVQKKIED